MIQISTKLTGFDKMRGLGPGSDALFDKRRMEVLGEFSLATVKKRVRSGLGADDTPMPPLSSKKSGVFAKSKFVRLRAGYAAWKAGRGLNAYRDLWGTGKQGGHMLDNLTVRSVTGDSVKMGITSRIARAKAWANEQLAPWLAFSPSDKEKIVAKARELFREEIRAIGSNWLRIVRKFRRAA